MSALVVDRMGNFVSSLKLESKVLSLSDDGTNTTLVVENVFHIRAMPSSQIRNVFIDGISYNVIAVNYDANTVTIIGVVLSASVYKVPNPFYWYGTLISTANEIRMLDDSQKVPMIYLNEIITEKRQTRPSRVKSIAQIRLAFADVYSNDWTRKQHHDLLIKPLSKLADYVFEQLDKRSCFAFREGVEVTQNIVPKWGEITRKGTKQKTFNEYLDAIEWVFDLEVCDCK